MFRCVCGRKFNSKNALNSHKGKCKIIKPEYISPSKKEGYINPMKGKTAWNKGLTKETSKIINKASTLISSSLKNKPGHKLTDETKLKLSLIMKEKYSNNPPKVAGRSKRGWYKGFYCRSSWELAYLIYQLEHNINIEPVSTGFKYIWNDSIHTYFPDFYLPDENVYIEIKGYYSERSIEKTNQFKGNLKILRYRDLQIYLQYVINKYGKNFISLYESSSLHNESKKQLKLKEQNELKQQIKENQIEEVRQRLLNSNIDFSKIGWVGEASKIIGITPQKVNQWMKRNMLEFYNDKCFKRKSRASSVIG